jgi:hypothetical protein
VISVTSASLASFGRRPNNSEAGATSTYVRASLSEVAAALAALAALTGEPHPLAASAGWLSGWLLSPLIWACVVLLPRGAADRSSPRTDP